MTGRKISFETSHRLLKLIRDPYRPEKILDLKDKLDEKISQMNEIRAENGEVSEELLKEIEKLDKQIDDSFLDWAEGRLT